MKNKIVIFIIVILILAIGGFFWWWQGQKVQREKIEKEKEVPKEEVEEKIIESFGDIIVKETQEGKIVENKKEGISMKVPEDWEVNKYIYENVVLEIRKFGPNQTLDTELQDGAIFYVYVDDNLENLIIEEWIAKRETELPEEIKKSQEEGIEIEIIDLNGEVIYEKIGNKKVAKTVNKVVSGTDEYDQPVFLEDSEEISMSFVSNVFNNRVLTFRCISAGPNYKDYSKECEDIMKDKIQSEF